MITGALDANIPARVALRTEKAIESKMMLRERGAESLLGRGDLLFRDMGAAVRLQAPMTTVEERRRLFRGREGRIPIVVRLGRAVSSLSPAALPQARSPRRPG